MDILEGAIVYLAGAITFDKKDGVIWRQSFKELCKNAKLPISFYDPCDKPKGLGCEIGLEKNQTQIWKDNEEYDKVTSHVQAYRHVDLRMVDNSHFIVWYIDVDISTIGSVDEFKTAETQCKPRFIIIKQGKKKAPDWVFGMVESHNDIFNSTEDLVEYLEKLNSGEIKLDKRWILYNGKLI